MADITTTERLRTDARAFDAFAAAGRIGKPSVWRFLGGVLLIAFAYSAGTGLGFLIFNSSPLWLGGDETLAGWMRRAGALNDPSQEVVFALLASALFGLGMTIPAVVAAQRLIHQRPFGAVLGAERRLRWDALGIGGLTALLLTGATLPIAVAAGALSLEVRALPDYWPMIAFVVAILVIFQASAEELVFRGYVLQWLAARFRSPLIWAVAPSLIFGLMHFNGQTDAMNLGYVGVTVAFGVFAAALVWRTGGLSHVIGYHIANNWLALLVFDPPVGIEGLGVFRVVIDPDVAPYLLAADAMSLLVAYLILSRFVREERRPAPSPFGA